MNKHSGLLIALAHANNAVARSRLKSLKKDAVGALIDCARAIINKKVRLSPSQLTQVHRYKDKIVKLVSPRTSLIEKKRALQKGGFLGLLLKPLLSVLGGALGGGLR